MNVDYRLSPGVKAPTNINDGYASLKWVLANHEMLGIDKDRVMIAGTSGGGYVSAGVSMRLAEKNEGHLIRFSAML